jgi:Tfp pilus assembly protein PilX
MSRRLRQEDGIALVMALGITVVLVIFVASMISFTSSSQRAARLSSGSVQALQYAESGLNAGYSKIVNQNTITGGNPTAANLLGCNGVTGSTDTNGPSNCATPAADVVCLTGTTCSSGAAGSASVYGFFSGSNPATYNGTTVAASTWLLVATGFARNPEGATIAKSATAIVKISPLDNGQVASVWNHIFMTAPLVPNVCQVSFGGNNLVITSPLYVIGNLCLSGQNVAVQEAVGGQAIDLMVGGKLVLSGSGSKVGADSSHPITSGVVSGGCTNVSVSSSTSTCSAVGFNYWVTTLDTFVQNNAPAMSSSDIAADYAAFDPGPNHACAAGGLPSTTFDNDGVQNGTNTSFELVPSSSYTCVSQNGSSTGQLSWNASTKMLTVTGSVFLDGNLTISQSAQYTGTAVLEVAGTVTFNGNATQLCATTVNPCNFNAWQGSSGNNSMLTLVALTTGAGAAVTFTDNSQTFQGSIWTQPTSHMTFVKNGVTVEGPISIGSFDATFNNASFKPLPVIKNMPTGAPIPPNTSATIGALTVTK